MTRDIRPNRETLICRENKRTREQENKSGSIDMYDNQKIWLYSESRMYTLSESIS